MGLSFLISGGQLRVVGDARVVRRSDVETIVEAEQLLDAANTESRRLIEAAEAEVSRLREQGHREGLRQAREEMVEEMARVAARHAAMLESERARLARIALSVVRRLVATLDPEALFDEALRRVTEQVRAERFLRLRVAPRDMEAAQRALHRLMTRCAGPQFVDIAPDAELAPSSCIVESELGVVDASLDGFMQRLELAVAECFVAPAPDTDQPRPDARMRT
jgi:type III secretion protein L